MRVSVEDAQLYTPAEYTALTGSRWQRLDLVAPRGKKPALDWQKASGKWTTAVLPIESDKAIAANESRSMLALKQQFEINESPARAVLEIRFKNGSFNRKPQAERLDGHQPRPATTTRVAITLDGKLLRDHDMAVHIGHGKCVSYLELTDEEVASLTSGSHEIGLLLPSANEIYSLDVQLLSYR